MNNRMRSLIVVAVLGLFAAGCSQSAEPDEATDTSTADSTEGESSESGDDAQAEDAVESDDPVDDETDAAPPSDEELVVSFIITDIDRVSAALGFEAPDQGDLEAQINAVVDHVNDAGGVAGRPVVPAIHVFDALTDSPLTEEELCNAITQDDQAFAVVMTGQFQENARPCYAGGGTMVLDVTLFPIDDDGYDELAPMLWSPFLPAYDDLVGGLADALVAEQWFDDATVGVVGIDSGMNQRVYEAELLPRLTDAGIEVASLQWVDPTDTSTLEATQQQAILEFKSAGVTHLVVLGGSRLAAFLIDIGSTQNFTPTYAMTSYDSPEFSIRNWADLMEGSVGISVLPGWDVADDQYPFPANDAEAECLDIFFNAGILFNSRTNARTGLLYCDAMRLLQAAGEGVDDLDADTMSQAVWALGDGFEAASVYEVGFDEGSYAGGAGYRVFAFDPDCSCMVLRGDTIAFDG